MQENYNEFQTSAVRKKKKTGIVIGAAAAVVVGGSGVAYAAVPAVQNTVNMTVMSPDKYCTKVYEDFFADMYESEKKTDADAKQADLKSITVDLGKYSDQLKDAVGYDVFRTLTIECDTAVSAKKMSEAKMVSGKATLKADDRSVVSGEVIIDIENSVLYLTVPELSEKSISLDLGEYMEGADDVLSESAKMQDMSANDMLKDYTDLISKHIAKGETELEKGFEASVADVDYKYNKLTTVFKEKEMIDFMDDFVALLEKDENLEKIMKPYGDQFSIDDITEDFKITEDDIPDGAQIVVDTFVDPEGVIRGLTLTAKTEEESNFISFVMAKEGSDVVVDFNMNDEANVTVTAVKSGDAYTGDVSFAENGSEEFSIAFENFEVIDNKYVNGVISMDISEFEIEDMDSISLAFEKNGDLQKISTEIAGVSCALEYGYGYEVKDISAPADAQKAEDFVNSLDEEKTNEFLNTVMKNLGFNEEDANTMRESLFAPSELNYEYGNEEEYEYGEEELEFNEEESEFNMGELEFNSNSFFDIEYNASDLNVEVLGNKIDLFNVDPVVLPESAKGESLEAEEWDYYYSDDDDYCVGVENITSEELPAEKCYICDIGASNNSIVINGVTVGSSVEELEKAFGVEIDEEVKVFSIYDTENYFGSITMDIADGAVTYMTINFWAE